MKPVIDIPIFADCGAPSLYNKLSRAVDKKSLMGATFAERKFDDYSYTETDMYKQYREGYIAFLEENKDKLDIYSNLDVINNPGLTYRNQKALEARGLKPIPVFHLGEDEKWLKRYIRDYDYIAIGGLIPNPVNVLVPILDKLFRDVICDKDGFPKVKVHGFACTSVPLMLRYPWYSVDSSTCKKLAIYGKIAVPTINMKSHSHISVSNRDTKTEHKVSPLLLEKIYGYCDKYGVDKETLVSDDIERAIFNYNSYSDILDANLKGWPWSVTTGEVAEDASHKMIFYYAGSNPSSGEAEGNFLRRICERDYKGRLQSFFYKNELKHIIDTKYGNIKK